MNTGKDLFKKTQDAVVQLLNPSAPEIPDLVTIHALLKDSVFDYMSKELPALAVLVDGYEEDGFTCKMEITVDGNGATADATTKRILSDIMTFTSSTDFYDPSGAIIGWDLKDAYVLEVEDGNQHRTVGEALINIKSLF